MYDHGEIMKYAELIDSDNENYSEDAFNQKPDEIFTIRRSFFDESYFISFIPKQWQNRHPKSIHTNWKLRISIDPADLDKSWEIIHPVLVKNVTAFKVVNHSIIEKIRRDRQADYPKKSCLINYF